MSTEKKGTLPAVETVQSKKPAPSRKRAAVDAAPPGPRGEAQRFVVVKGERYALPKEFTGREFVWIQEMTGVRMGEIDDAAGAGDVALMCALGVIAMRRAGREDVDLDDLLELPMANPDDGVDFVEDDGVPPTDDAATSSAD